MHWPLIKNLPHVTNFRFTKLAPYLAVVSVIFVIASGVSLFTRGLNLGTDFAGGTMMEIQTPGPAPIGDLRASLGQMGAEDPQVQSIGSVNAAILRFRLAENVNSIEGAEVIKKQLAEKFPGIQFKRVDIVGPKVSGELFRSGFTALSIAMGLMLLYIWIRFQLQFGVAAVVGVLHDAVLTLGMLSALHIEFSMTTIAALLTVVGYSMNEKVITFDRLRENLRKYKVTPLRDLIDLSENERLSRTLITGSTALLALAGMLFLGGPTLFPLIFTLVFGILIGTYSSIYVALPLVLVWGVNRGAGDAAPAKA
ncbi:protein translocase subunit SecF [Caulobacter segnis]|uniref:protein translocase subunit SecF n=1 Tax=Caulobacter segnis TaxID=88688 RepID=UPI0024103782|nr:protein translocase subunit SecF [Caulobacter segnis]MDG2523094.1 protein translocase subunit SecF [Caulobacter segnis]